MQHYLIVANRTLGGQQLLETISERAGRGPAEFWVLVPATPTHHLLNDFNALSFAFPVDPDLLPGSTDLGGQDQAVAEAKSRLEAELHRLHALGVPASGAVGDPNPLKAIDHALTSRTFSEIILSTLPPGASRWLAWDLPHRIRRRTDIPLTVIAAAADETDETGESDGAVRDEPDGRGLA